MDADSKKLSHQDKELLNKATSVGAKGAALVLSKMIRTSIDVTFPDFELVRFDNIASAELYRGKMVSFVFSRFHGDVEGTASLLFSDESTLTILKALLNRELSSLNDLETIDFSIIKETGNILIGSFLNALCDTFDLTILPTVPDVAVDYLSAIMDSFSSFLCTDDQEQLISVKTELTAHKHKDSVFGLMLLFFDPSLDPTILFRAKNPLP